MVTTTSINVVKENTGELSAYRTPPHNLEAEQALLGAILINNSIFLNGESIGYVTSGTFSPTLDKSIGLGYVSNKLDPDMNIEVEIRGKNFEAVVTKLPFLRR